MFRFLVAMSVFAPSTAFACAMPPHREVKVSLTELMEEIDEPKEPVAEAPAPPAETPPQVEEPAPPAPEPNT